MPSDDPKASKADQPQASRGNSPPGNDTNGDDLGQTRIVKDADNQISFDLSIPQTIGKYEVLRLLGQGGMGSVYLAHDPLIDRDVAIKVLHSGLSQDSITLQRFLAEGRSVGQLNHPNAIAIYEIGEDDGEYFIVMELAEGGNVRELLRKQAALPLVEACRIAIQAARGLGAAHKLGLIHRDVKPENLMLSAAGVVKLVDFGLAKKIDRDSELALTQTGQILGTPFYMSPEQIRGKELDARTDIYSLGATFYQLLTGEMPFTGESVAQLVYAHLEAERPDPVKLNPDLPTSCSTIIAKAMAVDPDDRYASISDMIRDMEMLTEHRPDPKAGVESVGWEGAAPRVLIVEPSKLAARVLADVFNKAGCTEVHCTGSAAEALSHVEDQQADVVIATRQLRDSTGETLLAQIRPLLDSADPMCVLMSSDAPLTLMARSKISGSTAFARKQSPDEFLRAVFLCTDYSFPELPSRQAAYGNSRVAVVSADGSVPQHLMDWLSDFGGDDVTTISSDQMEQTKELDNVDLVVWLRQWSESRGDLASRLQGPIDQIVGAESTLAVVDTVRAGLRLRGVRGKAFAASCDCEFDRARLERFLSTGTS